MHSYLDNQILTSVMRVYNNMAHPHHPDPKDVRWWIDRCSAKCSTEPHETYTQLRKQVNLIGVDCVTAEEFYKKYGAEGLLSRKDLFQYLYFLRQSPSWDCAYQSRSDCSDDMYMRNVSRVRTLLNSVVDEIWWEERLSLYNHNPHFPYFVTHFTDSMPICSLGGDLLDVLFNPKYASHVYNITVAVDNLGNIVWICDLMPGTSADVMIWDQRGPSRTHGQFFNFEIGAHDGAYKGRLHTAVPYIGRKTLSDSQQEYMSMACIVQGRSTSLHGCGNGGLSTMSGHALQRSCTAMCVFCSTLLSFAFADRLGIHPMDLGLMCLSLYGHRRRQPLRRRKMMMTVFVADCVATVLVIYPSVALAT